MSDWNQQVIAEFRANEGKVGGGFAGRSMVLVHHRGRKSGKEYVIPLMYLAKEGDGDSIYIFASKGGAPVHPEWYHNLVTAGETTVEVGTDSYPVTIRELRGEERDRVYADQVSAMPNFGEYEQKAEGIRIIPVLELTRH